MIRYGSGHYNADVDEPDHSGPFASSLWELPLLSSHFHPALKKEAAAIAKEDPTKFLVFLFTFYPV